MGRPSIGGGGADARAGALDEHRFTAAGVPGALSSDPARPRAAAAETEPRLLRTALLLALLVVVAVLWGEVRVDPAADSAWWPATGVAVGMTALLPRRAHPVVAVLVAVAIAAASVVSGQDLPVVLVVALLAGAEAWLGARILRGAADRAPRLDTVPDLVRLMIAGGAVGQLASIVGGIVGALGGGLHDGWVGYLTTGAAHLAGFIIVVPLFLVHHRSWSTARWPEVIAIAAFLGVVVVLTFRVTTGLPLAFLIIGPLAWSASRLGRLPFQWMMLFTAAAVSLFTAAGHGPFAVGTLDPTASVLVEQLFTVVIGVSFLTLALVVREQRRLTRAVQESEALFHATFDSLLSGMAIVRRHGSTPVFTQLNGAGRAILLSSAEEVEVATVLESSSLQAFLDVIGLGDVAPQEVWRGVLDLVDGRRFDVLLSRLPDAVEQHGYSIQFLDITDRLRAEAATEADLARAAEVQRALLPKDPAPLDGYEVAGACIPAKEVGGDFYDWYAVDGSLVFTLGDVMGKGVGAGMIAATMRSALRTARRDPDPTVAVERAADTLDAAVGATESFATLFHARLDGADGNISFVDAGHGLTLILRADGGWHRVFGFDLPLGALMGMGWSAEHAVLQPGDMLICMSDGVLDLYDETLGSLDEVVRIARAAGSPAGVARAFTEIAGATAAPDDVTVLAVRRALPHGYR